MKKPRKLLRLRPFNMANFSGGSGYMPLWAYFAAIVSVPATLLLWSGFAISLKTENGTLDYRILKRRLNNILLPICMLLFAGLFALMIDSLYGSTISYLPVTLWVAAIPTIGIYCSMFFSAKILNIKGILSKGRWLVLTIILFVLLIAIGLGVFFLLLRFSDSL